MTVDDGSGPRGPDGPGDGSDARSSLPTGVGQLPTNRRRVAGDVAAVGAWALVLLWFSDRIAWPPWAYYAVLLAGVVAYSLVTDPSASPGGARGPNADE